MENETNEDLWSYLRLGQTDRAKLALSLLYRRHIDSLYNFGLQFTTDKTLIEDVLQDLFLDFWKKNKALPKVLHVKVYMLKALRNQLLRKLTQQKRQPQSPLEDFPAPSTEPHEDFLKQKTQLKTAIANLPERQAEVIHLRYFQNLKNKEIGRILGIETQSVANLLRRALIKLKTVLSASD